LRISRKEYHGRVYAGKQCFKILHLPVRLESFGRLTAATFESQLAADWEQALDVFTVHYLEVTAVFPINATTKAHIIIHHLREYIRRTKSALGPTSEEVVESQHHLFKKFYARFKVIGREFPIYDERLLMSVVHFNAFR